MSVKFSVLFRNQAHTRKRKKSSLGNAVKKKCWLREFIICKDARVDSGIHRSNCHLSQQSRGVSLWYTSSTTIIPIKLFNKLTSKIWILLRPATSQMTMDNHLPFLNTSVMPHRVTKCQTRSRDGIRQKGTSYQKGWDYVQSHGEAWRAQQSEAVIFSSVKLFIKEDTPMRTTPTQSVNCLDWLGP